MSAKDRTFIFMHGKKIVVIAGPTASGKTGIGVKLAKQFNGEIVSADSRQVYRGLDLGTGKDLEEYNGVKYHMIDIVDPEQEFAMFKYLDLARIAIEDIFSRGKLPVVVGGTGLYIQGLTEGFVLEKSKIKNQKSKLRSSLPREQLEQYSIEQLNEVLKELDPEKHETVDRKNQHRLIRAIELAQEGLKPIKIKPDFEALQIAIDLPRKDLHDRIDKRVDERFKAGMLEEVIGLLNKGVDPEWLMKLGLEYGIITMFLMAKSELQITNKFPNPEIDKLPEGAELSSGSINIEMLKLVRLAQGLSENRMQVQHDKDFLDMSQDLKYKIHQYARRQITWLKRFPEVNWLSDYAEIERFVKIFLSH